VEPYQFTINPEAILGWIMAVGYPLLKVVSSWYITKREFQFPIWNREGVQVERRLHHLITAYIRNFAVNPEWAGMKLVAFIPVWLLSGWKYWDKFSPWRVRKVPAFCKTCNDTGWYKTGGFMRGSGTTHHQCQDCKNVPPVDQPTCHCVVCLDKGHVGPLSKQKGMRPCPHCERRKLIAEANSDENFWGDGYHAGQGVYCSCCHMPETNCDCRRSK